MSKKDNKIIIEKDIIWKSYNIFTSFFEQSGIDGHITCKTLTTKMVNNIDDLKIFFEIIAQLIEKEKIDNYNKNSLLSIFLFKIILNNKPAIILKNLQKKENQFVVKSNVITRAVKSSNATIMTFRLFVFGLAKLSDKQYQVKKDFIDYNISLAEFAKYYEIPLNNLYKNVYSDYSNKEVTLIEKEMNIISLFQIKTLYENESLDFDFTNLFLKWGYRKNTSKLYFKIYKEIFNKYFVN